MLAGEVNKVDAVLELSFNKSIWSDSRLHFGREILL